MVGADISFNERLLQIQVLKLTSGRELHPYALANIVAEKYRALLRQARPNQASLADPEVKQRAGRDWQSMGLELGPEPDFEGCFVRVAEFYRDLPWRIHDG
ncbi:MAG: hypothetical protein OXN89_16845 [Bryobacterales bacterium]|nr:hypothetical protein [Bryobacterales bacterium]